jgi:hypothetical protein
MIFRQYSNIEWRYFEVGWYLVKPLMRDCRLYVGYNPFVTSTNYDYPVEMIVLWSGIMAFNNTV